MFYTLGNVHDGTWEVLHHTDHIKNICRGSFSIYISLADYMFWTMGGHRLTHSKHTQTLREPATSTWIASYIPPPPQESNSVLSMVLPTNPPL